MALPHKKTSSYIEEKVHHPSYFYARYRACFFGPFRVTLDGQELGEPTWRRNRARGLLKWFLLNPGELFSIDQLSQMFWPDAARKGAVSNLHVTLHYLRHVLEPDLASGCPSTFIRRNRHNYYWFDLHDDWWSDVFDVHHLFTSAREAERRGEHSRAITLYDQMISYYSMTFLPEDIYEDMFAAYRRHYDHTYDQLLEHLLQLYAQAGQFDDALSCALQILAVDPYNEDAVKTMVHIHLRQGNRTGAIRQLNDFQTSLKKDLGMEPGKDIRALRSSILQGETFNVGKTWESTPI